MPPIRVFKFGGTSVGSADAVRAAAEIAKKFAPSLAVVVSASSGTTDLLLSAARAALARDREGFEIAAQEFRARHLRLVDELVADATEGASLRETMERSSRELFAMCESVGILRELSPRVEDAIVARGERAMAMICAATLRQRGVPVSYVDAADVIVTEKRGQWPDFARSERLAEELVRPLIERGEVVVLPGFIAQGPSGEVVTLGRGGSDFSAAIIAIILARTLGMRLDLADIAVEMLYPDSADDSDAKRFLEKLKDVDGEIAARIVSAKSRGSVLRYAARIGEGSVRVGIEEVGQTSPMGRLRGTDNHIVIRTRRYDTNPLVVIGPGAGAEVTAAGVLNDIVAIATREERRSRFALDGASS